MEIAVVVPCGGYCPQRARVWGWLREQYRWPVVEGWCFGPWSKAVAVADALTATAADVLVIADADVLCDLDAAVDAVLAGADYAVPHKYVYRLSPKATDRVLGGEPPTKGMPSVRPGYPGVLGGGVVVIRRDVYAQVPLDPRFVGWGGEDHAFGYALLTLAEGWRGDAPLFHLWHPPQDRSQRSGVSGTRENELLRKRYKAARNYPADMRALLAEVTADADRDAADAAVHPHAHTRAAARR